MQTDETIPVNEFCIHHKIELSFIHSLKDVGLIEVIQLDEKLCVPLNWKIFAMKKSGVQTGRFDRHE